MAQHHSAITAPPPARHRRAFTLVEVLIASTILAGAALALCMPFSRATHAQRLNTLRATAANLAAQQMERLATFSCDDLLADYAAKPTSQPLRSIDGAPITGPGLDAFALRIGAAEVAIPVAGQSTDDADRFCRVVVVVDHPDLQPVRLARLFARE